VVSVRGLTIEAEHFPQPVGALVRVEAVSAGGHTAYGEVIGCEGDRTMTMLFSPTRGLAPGDRIVGLQSAQTVGISPSVLGRVLNGLGQPIDGGPPIAEPVGYPHHPDPIGALDREPIHDRLATGVRALDVMVTAGRGQRLGIFSGPGVGKSTLLGSIARHTEADVSVIALIGERGREVRDFIEKALGPEGLARSVVVVSTSDESPLLRVRATYTAAAAAEFFRDQGRDVILMMDSLTRFCQAQRQIGLVAGEPPATKGYTPSVFSSLASLLERAGNVRGRGSITGFYTILVEGDDMTEPISDASRAILDGHVALSRRLANRGHFPAVDVLDSVSRVADDVSEPTHVQARVLLRRVLALFDEVEELLNIGAYAKGSNAEYDVAIEFKPKIDALLRQGPSDRAGFEETVTMLENLAIEIGHALAKVNNG